MQEASSSISTSGGSVNVEKTTPLRLLRAIKMIGANEGVRGFYKGFGPGWVFFVTHGAVQFSVYEELKRFMRVGEQELTATEAFGCGGLSKLVAIIATYPIQLVRSRMQQQSAEKVTSFMCLVDKSVSLRCPFVDFITCRSTVDSGM